MLATALLGLSASALLKAPLVIQIEAPASVRSGEAFRVKAWLVNQSAKPVVVVVPSVLNYALGMNFRGNLWRGEEEVATEGSGRWYGQWVSPNEFGVSAFATIKPGGRAILEDAPHRLEYVSGERPGLISDLQSAPKKNLPPGNYVYRAKWSFSGELVKQNGAFVSRGFPSATLTPAGKELFAKAWVGTVSAEKPITIVAR